MCPTTLGDQKYPQKHKMSQNKQSSEKLKYSNIPN